MTTADSVLRSGSKVSLTGTVTSRETRRKRDGATYVRARLVREGASDVPVIWWNETDAVLEGERVVVEGSLKEYNGSLELHARQTRVLRDPTQSASKVHPHHRVIEYLIQCVEAEAALGAMFDLQSREIALQKEGADPIVTLLATDEDTGVVVNPEVVEWCRKQSEQGATSILVGYPIVTGIIEDRGIEQVRVAPLFTVECDLSIDGADVTLQRTNVETEDLNPQALVLLGIDERERRNDLEDELNESGLLAGAHSAAERLQARLDILQARGVVDSAPVLDPLSLGPVATNRGVSNALMFMPATSRVGPTKQLLDELQQLGRAKPDELERGPLGLMLTATRVAAVAGVDVHPTITETNYRQDLAAHSALKSMLTVVTGPPGTGKSQVLVNTIVAALANGQSVLVASKNNAAVDVVIDRLERVAPDVRPIRTGNRAARESTVSKLRAAVTAVGDRDPQLATVRLKWDRCAARIAQLHHAFIDHERLDRAYREASVQLDAELTKLPAGLFSQLDQQTINNVLGLLKRSIGRSMPFLAYLFPWLRRRWIEKRVDEFFREAKATVPAETLAALTDRRSPLMLRDSPSLKALASRVRNIIDQIARARELESKQVAIAQERESLPTIDQLEISMADHDPERQQMGRLLLTSILNDRKARVPASARAAGSRVLTTLAGDPAARWPTQVLGSVFADLLPLVPVWALTSLSAKDNVPLVPGLFDLVIIDEASQGDVASMVPLLYRAKRAVVIGDPHQLTHVTRLKSHRAERLATTTGLSSRQHVDWNYVKMNCFELARRCLDGVPILLDQHFRCHPAIVEFSNRHSSLYDGGLVVCTDPGVWKGEKGIEWVDVRGEMELLRSGSRRNAPEAEAVIRTIAALLARNSGSALSVGVVSPYHAQVVLIERMVAEALSHASSVAVKTVHQFQGDERDVMIYSPAIAGSPEQLGALMALNKNLVNVAITRARRQLIIVGDLEVCLGTQTILRDLAEYCMSLQEAGAYTPFELDVRNEMAGRGLVAEIGVMCGVDRLGIAVTSGDRRIAVQCDGHAFRSEDSPDAADLRLAVEGYEVRRISPRQIGRDLKRTVDALLDTRVH